MIPRPQHFDVQEEPGRLEITWRWLRGQQVMMVFFCIAWDAFLYVWYRQAFTTHAPWLMVVFPIGHVAVGIGITYSTLAGLLNRTRLEVAGRMLSIEHGPVPWLGQRRLHASSVRSLYVFERETRSDDSVTYTYDLRAMLRDGSEVTLLAKLPERGHAQYLQHELEQVLDVSLQPKNT